MAVLAFGRPRWTGWRKAIRLLTRLAARRRRLLRIDELSDHMRRDVGIDSRHGR